MLKLGVLKCVFRCAVVCCKSVRCRLDAFTLHVVVCCVLWCVVVCCSVLQCVAVCCSVLQCVAVCCSVLRCFEVCCRFVASLLYTTPVVSHHTAMHCNALQRTATCTATHHLSCFTLLRRSCRFTLQHVQRTATHCSILQHTATCTATQHLSCFTLPRCYCRFILHKCNTLQRTATHCNTL